MRYCHECGAEVAPDDTFCPFCGIALHPFAAQNSNATALNATQLSPAPEEASPNNYAEELPKSEAIEPETILQRRTDLPFANEAAKTPEKTKEETEAAQNNRPSSDAPAPIDEQSTPIDAEELYIATIPNAALESFAREAEVPFEEMRVDETDFEEPARISAPSDAANEKPTAQTETNSFEQSTVHDEITEPVPISERRATGEETAAGEISETAMPAASESENIFEDKTLISQPLAAAAVPDELISNQSDAAVPRPTEAQNETKDTPGSKSPKLKPLADGTVLNRRYEIVRRIGGGGMGAVYLASDRNLGGVTRAVKEMIQAYVDEAQHEKAVEDFRREALLLSSLEHPAIPTIYDYFVDNEENRFYLVMKYISGGDLASRFRAAASGKIGEQTMTEWAIQIADVLDYLHNHEPPIVYRDLKPSNIMIDGKTGRVMLVDFGIARIVNKEEKGNTAVGTMGYAPSEQYAGNAEPRSDIYALGATMFHLLTGSDPQNNPLLIFDFTKNPRPRAINPNLSVEIERILMRAVEYNANMRFATAAEMRNALHDHLERIRAGRLTFVEPEAAAFANAPNFLHSQPAAVKSAPVGMAFCGFCGERIAANDMFCAYCGSRQPEADRIQAAAQAAFPAAKQSARLVVETGAFEEPAFLLEKETNILGREDRRSNIFPEVDLTKYDVASPKISRRHARIYLQGATFMIEDLGSANGTTLVSHDAQIVKLQPRQPHVLTHGDKLKLGETTLHFFVN